MNMAGCESLGCYFTLNIFAVSIATYEQIMAWMEENVDTQVGPMHVNACGTPDCKCVRLETQHQIGVIMNDSEWSEQLGWYTPEQNREVCMIDTYWFFFNVFLPIELRVSPL